MKVQKIVSLDEETMRHAQTIPNFSGWVRQNLRLHKTQSDMATLQRRIMYWSTKVYALQEWIGEHCTDQQLADAIDYATAQEIRARQPGQD